jgi:putative SOS response-associated peptidase YedK
VRTHHTHEPREAIAKEFGVTRFAEFDWHPRYNVAPSQIVETIMSVNGDKRLGPMRWGVRPVDSQSLRRSTHGRRPCPPRRCSGTRSDATAALSWRMASTGVEDRRASRG